VNVEHTYIGDLIIELRHNDQIRTLHNRNGGGTDNIDADYQLQEYNGQDMSGAWELTISDNAGIDTGSLTGWSVSFEISEAEPPDVTEGTVAPSSAGQLVITEVLADPSGVYDSEGEWFEIYNTTDLVLDLSGAVFSDDDSDSFTVEGEIIIDPGEYLTFGRVHEVAYNGGAHVDYAYGEAMTLANGDDELVLTVGGIEIDRIVFDDGSWPMTRGAAFQLDPSTLDYASNDSATSWCAATTEFGTVSDLGTPGQPNQPCQ